MNSLHSKLIVVVFVITVSSFLTVVFSNMEIIRADKQKTLESSNRQVSEIVSRSVSTRMTEYRRELQYLLKAYLSNPEFKVESDYFPDYLWIQFLNWEGEAVFEWLDQDKLSQTNLIADRLLGKRNRDSLFAEVKQVLSRSDEWLLFNSTVDPFLPSFLFASAYVDPEKQRPTHVILAEIHAEPLFNQIHPRKGQELLLIDSHQNILFSTRPNWDPSKIVLSDTIALGKIKELEIGKHLVEIFNYSDREPQLTWLHKFKEGQGLTLLLQEPASNLLEGQRDIQIKSFLVGVIVLIVAITLIVLFASRITSPLKRLANLMEKAGKGEFTGRINLKSKDEIGQLARVFNKMLEELANRDAEIEGAKQKLIQSEKMSAFGQMSAGIAHEVKNPLAGILGYAQIAKKKLEDKPEIANYLEIIEKETTRCKEIVENLMKFARQEKATLSRIDINKAVKDSVRLVEHQITVSGIKIVQIYASDGSPIYVEGNTNQIQQVMLNLMLNAQHAMENKGTLTVTTHLDEPRGRVMIMVSDTGCGMSEEVKARIFEPFYTTKGVGKGTGLGLAVSLGIIKDHKGSIDVDSTTGKGTTFTISLPLSRGQEESKNKAKVA